MCSISSRLNLSSQTRRSPHAAPRGRVCSPCTCRRERRPRRGRLRRLIDLIHVFDMRGSAVAGRAPRPLHDFESSARRTGQDPAVLVRREGDRYVVLGRDPVAQLRHIYRVPQVHSVETSVETAQVCRFFRRRAFALTLSSSCIPPMDADKQRIAVASASGLWEKRPPSPKHKGRRAYGMRFEPGPRRSPRLPRKGLGWPVSRWPRAMSPTLFLLSSGDWGQLRESLYLREAEDRSSRRRRFSRAASRRWRSSGVARRSASAERSFQ